MGEIMKTFAHCVLFRLTFLCCLMVFGVAAASYIRTYIIGHYNPLDRIIDLVSHIAYVVCGLILYISGGTYSLKSTPNDRFFLINFS